MNVITYAHVISLYPHATFIDHVAFRSASWSEADVLHRAKYQWLGWKMLTHADTTKHLEFCDRRIGDRFTWVIPLRFDSCPPKNPRVNMVFANTWRLSQTTSAHYLLECYMLHLDGSTEGYCFSGGPAKKTIADSRTTPW